MWIRFLPPRVGLTWIPSAASWRASSSFVHTVAWPFSVLRRKLLKGKHTKGARARERAPGRSWDRLCGRFVLGRRQVHVDVVARDDQRARERSRLARGPGENDDRAKGGGRVDRDRCRQEPRRGVGRVLAPFA